MHKPWPRWFALALSGVAALALGIRLVHLAATWESPFVRHPVGDAARYLDWARAIANGQWFSDQPYYQAPLYPYVLGSYFHVAESSVAAVRALQAAWGTLACVLIALAAGRWFGRRAGVLAGALMAIYPPAVFFDSIVQKASLDGLLVCALLAAWPVRGSISLARAGLVGLLAGWLCLTRENALVWLPLLFLGLVVRRTGFGPSQATAPRPAPGSAKRDHRGARRRSAIVVPHGGTLWRGRAAVGAAYVAAVMAALSPAVVHNYLVGGEWVVTTSQAGSNFYIGNHRGADGRYVPLVPGHETPAHEREDATRLAEADAGRPLTAKEVSRYWFARAWSDIRSDPVAWAKLTGMKLLMTWNRYEVSDAESLTHQAALSPALAVVTPVWHFGVLAPLAAMGAALTWSRSRRLWIPLVMIALMTLAVAAFYVLARYRFPLALLLIPFAAQACVRAVGLLRARAWRRLAPGVLAGLAVGVAANLPVHDVARLDGLAWMNAGVAHAELGEREAARACFEEAVRRHPSSSEANYNLAMALAMQGDWGGAIERYEASLRGGKALPGVEYNLGVAYERIGERDKAAAMFEAALARDPNDGEARAALERLRRSE